VQRNPFDSALLPRPVLSREGKTQLVSDADAAALLRVAANDPSPDGRRDTAVLRLLYDTGMRRESVALLRRGDLRDGHAWITVKGEDDKEPVALLPRTEEAIAAWLHVAPPSPFVFPGPKGPVAMTKINKIITSRCVEAGIAHVHPHCFRAAFITAAYDNKMYERDIQKAVHHRKAETTRRYDRGQRGDQIAAVIAKSRDDKGAS
jgi:integrase